MNTNIKRLVYVIITLNLLVGSYLLGKNSAKCEETYNTLNDVSHRYFEMFGNPDTVEAQTIFEYVVYGQHYQE